MKILIAYDGSECSDAAIVDLKRAGLPRHAEVVILSVAEMSAQLAGAPYGALLAGPGMYTPESVESEVPTDNVLHEAKTFAAQAADRLRADFSEWRMETEAWVDAPGSAIIRKARAWSPDLIVVGSHGRSGLSRLVIGSVSEHVLHHVNCSVRISRHRLHSQDRAISLIVGVDGSSDSRAAVQWIALRDWPAGTEIRAVAVEDIRLSAAAAAEGVYPSNVVEHESQSKESAAAHEAQEILSKAGLIATYQVLTGIPGEVLTAEAEKVAADGIFVGARGLSKVERILLGSVSTSVASRAHCSVEVVRDHLKN